MPVTVLRSSVLSPFDAICHGFTTRQGGLSQGSFASLNLGWYSGDCTGIIAKNYQIWADDVGIDLQRMVYLHQCHGTQVLDITHDDQCQQLRGYRADGLMTSLTHVTLIVQLADCLPLLLFDPVQRVICALHAGWRGTVANILPMAISQLRSRYASEPQHLKLAIGPGISLTHFEVGREVVEQFEQNVGLQPSDWQQRGGRYYLDLSAINCRLAIESGILLDNISRCNRCSFVEQDLFFSYRRDGKGSGRQIGFISLLDR